MTHEDIAARLLTPVWRGISAEYKARYKATIWRQFEDNIRSAAYTSSLPKFVTTLSAKLGVQLHERDAAAVRDVVASGEDGAILRALRDDTTLLVLHVRVANEERQAARKGSA